eukprot:5076501-Karenia_brevis.AAC.1
MSHKSLHQVPPKLADHVRALMQLILKAIEQSQTQNVNLRVKMQFLVKAASANRELEYGGRGLGPITTESLNLALTCARCHET